MPVRHVITGGSGFTGTYLASSLLDAKEEVIIFDLDAPSDVLKGRCGFIKGDVRSGRDLARIGLQSGDIVYHLAARQFHLKVPHRDQGTWFADVNVGGTEAVLEAMTAGGVDRAIFLSTDMVYGWPDSTPVATAHPRRPLGPYGKSKLRAEDAFTRWGQAGGRVTLFRPRMISGPGRLGILGKLFKLVDKGLPIPTIGSGHNRYQMIAVQDCVDAMLAAVQKGFPAGPFNLGSRNPPQVRDLLRQLVRHAQSRSIVVPTPGMAVKWTLAALNKAGIPLLHPEQYLIADINYLLDTSETSAVLGWTPKRSDQDMLIGAYDAYRRAATEKPG